MNGLSQLNVFVPRASNGAGAGAGRVERSAAVSRGDHSSDPAGTVVPRLVSVSDGVEFCRPGESPAAP